MKKILAFGTASVTVSAALLAWGLSASVEKAAAADQPTVVQAPADPAAVLDRKAIEEIVRNYLLDNPEIIVEMQSALESRQKEEQRVSQVETIKNSSDEIFNATYDGIYGNPAGKYTLVEFFDYNCGYCKRAMDDMQAMTDANPEVRFVLKEFPILGPDSQKAHVVSMAFRALMPEKYGDFHEQLLGGAGRASEDNAIQLALSLGADEAALRKEMQNPEIVEAFGKTYELANKLGISGTPSYVVGDEVIFGALGREVLEEKVAQLRACGTANC